MHKSGILHRLLTTTAICGAAMGAATPAHAEGTGTRVGSEATAPVVVVTREEIELQGTTQIEDLISSLPQGFESQGGGTNNGAAGIATANLRGLGSSRTLVLLNGRRIPYGDPRIERADLNLIPAGLVDRVEVLTGGASSVYGSDAVSGVVNFITRTHVDGVRFTGTGSFFYHNNDAENRVIDALDFRNFVFPEDSRADGEQVDLTFQIGTTFAGGLGHVMGYAGYREIKGVRQGERDYGFCSLNARSPFQVELDPTRILDCDVSVASPNGTFFTDTGTYQVGPNRTFIPGSTGYNFAPFAFYQRPDERYTAGAYADFEISSLFKLYFEGNFMEDKTRSEIVYTGDFGTTDNINCDNPLLSAQQRAIVCAPANLIGSSGFPDGGPPQVFFDPTTGNPYFRGFLQPLRRNVEGGLRTDVLEHTNYRAVFGMRGDLSDVWSYDSYYQFGRVDFAETYLNDFSVTRLTRAVDVVDNPTTVGIDPVCRSVVDGSDPDCVPYDIYALDQVSPEAIDYLSNPALQDGHTEQHLVHFDFTGDLGSYGLKTPWTTQGFGFNIGAEYRKETLELLVDDAFRNNDLAGVGAPILPVDGDFDVREAFAEVRIPLVHDLPFFNELSFELGYRYSDYGVQDRHFSTDTYKFAANWSPVQDIRFRSNYNRSVRAPNIQDLFEPQRVVFDGNIDPCAGPEIDGRVNGYTEEECARTGVTPGQFGNILRNPSEQYHGLIGGNPDLDPEVADTWTAGVVIQPRFLPRFALTVDWFDIEIDKSIDLVGADQILFHCIEANELCGEIHRNSQGSLWTTQDGYVRDLPFNVGGLSTSGLDFTASYSYDLGRFGSLGFNFVGTWLDELVVNPFGPTEYDCAGLFGNVCGTPSPEWRSKTRVTLVMPNGFGASLQWRYFSSLDHAGLSSDPDLENPFVGPGEEKLPSVSYLDLVLTYRIGDHYNFRVGANNILDKDPPIAPLGNLDINTARSGNTYPNVYDALGRYIFAGVTLDF
ncbi:MAG TPA: TonB-dependent receptor [Croceibacterium sp.]|nr:TonB-dependent receptor [Croceibacterium sp.]